MGNARTAVAGDSTAEEEDQAAQVELSGVNRRHAVSPEERLQLGGLTQGPASVFNGLLALQRVAQSGLNRAVDDGATREGA